MRLALYQPDIPQNTGAILRLAACLAVRVDIIEPCGFVLDDRRLRRVAMDYATQASIVRHRSWAAFAEAAEAESRRLVLLTTKTQTRHIGFRFGPADTLLLGRESAGVPEQVRAACAHAVRVPIRGRSLNVVTAAAIVLGEALRQTAGFPASESEERPG